MKFSDKPSRWMLQALLLLGLGCGSMQAARADVNCTPSGGPYPHNTTVPLSGSFYAGADMPVGSTLYQANIKIGPGATASINCDAPFSIAAEFRANGEPSGAPFAIPGRGDWEGFPTNVPGIAVVFYKGPSFTDTNPLLVQGYWAKDSAGTTEIYESQYILALVKTGTIASGAVVNGSSFPSVSLSAPAQAGYTGFPMNNFWVANFTGSIQFMSQTCTTPDVTVDLGQHLPDEFTSVGATTAWQYAPIVMNNCPTFTGLYGSKQSQTADGSVTPSGGNLNANLFEVTLTPTTELADAGDPATFLFENATPAAATGMGYQLGYNTDINASTIGSGMVWTKGQAPISISAPSDGRATVKIPLFLRYVRYGSRITPGPMNGKVVATINYK